MKNNPKNISQKPVKDFGILKSEIHTFTGIIGSIQTTEVLKYLLDIGKLLKGRFLILDGKDMSFEEVKFFS